MFELLQLYLQSNRKGYINILRELTEKETKKDISIITVLEILLCLKSILLLLLSNYLTTIFFVLLFFSFLLRPGLLM